MRVRPQRGFIRSLNRAPTYVQLAVHSNLGDVLARGHARIDDDRLRARIVGNWYLYFRFPTPGEESVYPRDACILLSVREETKSR
jgi:hypothetical protein